MNAKPGSSPFLQLSHSRILTSDSTTCSSNIGWEFYECCLKSGITIPSAQSHVISSVGQQWFIDWLHWVSFNCTGWSPTSSFMDGGFQSFQYSRWSPCPHLHCNLNSVLILIPVLFTQITYNPSESLNTFNITRFPPIFGLTKPLNCIIIGCYHMLQIFVSNTSRLILQHLTSLLILTSLPILIPSLMPQLPWPTFN